MHWWHNFHCLTLPMASAGAKYDYGQVTIEELDLGDELANLDLDEDHAPDQERHSRPRSGGYRSGRSRRSESGSSRSESGSSRSGSGSSRSGSRYRRSTRRSAGGRSQADNSGASKNICRNYASGQCTYGDRCHFKHVTYSAADRRPPAQYYSSPSSSRASTPCVSRPGSANRQTGKEQTARGSRGPSPVPLPSHSHPSSAGPRLPVVQQKPDMAATFTVPANKVGPKPKCDLMLYIDCSVACQVCLAQ